MDIDLIQQNLLNASLAGTRSNAGKIDTAQQKQKEQALKEACEGFEAILLNTLLKSMRNSLPGDAVFNESHGMNIYRSMYDQYLSEDISKSQSGPGLKEFLYRQLKDSL